MPTPKTQPANDAVTQKIQAFAEELQRLRVDVDAAEGKMLRRAIEIEASISRSVWQEFYGSFDSFLTAFHICAPSRYRDFVAAIQKTDVNEAADDVGVAATIQAAKIPNKERRTKFLGAAKTRVEEVGVPWSNQEAKTQRVRVGGSAPQDSEWNKKATERDQLRARVIQLEKELQAAEQEIAELREENAKLRGIQKKKRA